MTDITELAQSLENAASKALIEEGLTWFCEEQLSHEDGIALHKADAEFIALANPTNILALVEALEKSEKTSEARREAIGITHKRAARERDRANAAEEALEKAQAQSSKWLEAYHKAVSIGARYEERIAELESRTVTAAAADVLAERQRQVTAEGWSPKHDDQYKNTELAFAASCYAFHAAAATWDLEDDGIPYDIHPVPKQWPWDPSWWKPTDARRDLVKAGALILAEIERIDRADGIKVEVE